MVVALASNDDQLARLKTDLESPRINAGIRGDTAVITSDNAQLPCEYAVPQRSDAVVHDGGLVCQPALRFLAVLGLIATSIMGLALTAMFKRHARKRLGSGDNQ